MRNSPADKLDVGDFVHPATVTIQCDEKIPQISPTWCWEGERRRSRRADRRPSWRTTGWASDCFQSSSVRLARARSSKTGPGHESLQFWPSVSRRGLTAALETTVFWSHSIRTSRNVTFLRSMACRTFPGRRDIINQLLGQVKSTRLDKTVQYKTWNRSKKFLPEEKCRCFSNLWSALELFQSSPVVTTHNT